MSMLKEERKALRDEFERVYGIHLREDDELLPIIQFITEAAKLADMNVFELKKILEEIKETSGAAFGEYSIDYKNFLEASRQLLVSSANESKLILNAAKKDIEALPKMVNEFRSAVNQLKIPTHVTVKRISFDDGTMSFLWKFFTVSIVLVFLTISVATIWVVHTNEEAANIKNQYRTEQYEWLSKYYEQLRKDAPSLTQKFIERNPRPKKSNFN